MPKKQQKYVGFNMSDKKQLRTFIFLSHLGKYNGEFISELVNGYLDCHSVNVNTLTKDNARVIAAMVKNMSVVDTSCKESENNKNDTDNTLIPDDITDMIKEQISLQITTEIAETVRTQLFSILGNILNLIKTNTYTAPTDISPAISAPTIFSEQAKKHEDENKPCSDTTFDDSEKEQLKSILSGF